MNDIRYFLDVSPLRDYAWTGIPTVTARIARYLLKTRPQETVFYYGPDVVLPQFVAVAIDGAPGGYLRAFVEAGTAIAGSLDNALRGDFTSVGIFPNINSPLLKSLFDQPGAAVTATTRLATPSDVATTRKIAAASSA